MVRIDDRSHDVGSAEAPAEAGEVGADRRAGAGDAVAVVAAGGGKHLPAILKVARTLVIGDELAHAKPHPLPYLTGLERLGAAAAQSVAFEDSPSGLRAAVDARIPAIGLTTALGAPAILEIGATLAVPDFRDARVRDLILKQMAKAA